MRAFRALRARRAACRGCEHDFGDATLALLILPIQTHGDVLAFEDDAAAGRLCVALARPRLARRADGSSAARLVRWTTQSAGIGTATGGRLTLDVNVDPSADDLAAAGLAGRDTHPLPWLDAKIRLEGPQFDPVDADVSTAIGTVAAASVDLTPASAAVLAPLLQSHAVSPLQVTWVGHVLVRLPPVEVIATADVTEIRRRIDLIAPGRRLTIIRSIIDANARIEIRGAGNVALEQALRDWVLGELTARLDAGRPLDVRAAASEVVHWPVQLAATLDDFLPSASRGSIVETIILDSSEIRPMPPVDVRVLADFSGALERVDVRLAPASSGQTIELAFSSDALRTAAVGAADFRWSRRVKLKLRPPGDWSPWIDVHGATAVIVPVSAPSSLNIEVVGAALDFTARWSMVRVIVTHDPPDAAPQSQAIELTAAQTSATWTVPLEGLRGPVKAQVTYVARQGQSVERVIENVAGDQVIVTDPLEGNCVPFTLLPAGTGWSDVALAMVDLRYADGAYVVDETVELRTLTDFVDWSVPARPDGPQTMQWRLHASFTDGRFTSGDWQAADRGVVIVRIDGVPKRTVQVIPIYFDPAVARSATLRLRSGSQIETLVLTDRTKRSVTLGPGPFSWTVQWTAADGTPSPETAAQDGEDVLVVPPFSRA
jgi:hypothetical protein